MQNKRTLKKRIRVICQELFTEAVAVSLYGSQDQRERAEALLYTIVKMEDNFTMRVCHPEPGMSAKAYYDDLREKFSAQATEILDQLNA